jgi:hypothetical protein
VTALLLIVGLWLASAAIVVPYLLHVARIQVEQAGANSAEPTHKVSGNSEGIGMQASAVLFAPADLTTTDDPEATNRQNQQELIEA